MTSDHDPTPDPAKPPEHGGHETLAHRLGERVEGAVERVEETVIQAEHAIDTVVEGVVEHVPEGARASVRWTVQKIVLLVMLALAAVIVLGAVGTGYYLWNHTSLAARELTGRVNAVLRDRSDVELTLDGLSGNPLGTVVVHHPRVRFRGTDQPAFLEADAMTMRWSTWDLLWSRRGAIVIELDHPVLRLKRGSDGKLRIPKWEAGAPAQATHRSFVFELRLRHGELLASDPELETHGLDVDLRYATDPARLDLRSLSWTRGPWGSQLRRLRGDAVAGDSVIVRVTELDSPDLQLRGRAAWKTGMPTRLIHVDVGRVRWAWLARVFRNDVLDVPGQGAGSADLEGSRNWRGSFRSSFTWDVSQVDAHGDFTYANGRLLIAPLDGLSRAGGMTDGKVTWSPERWTVEGHASHADPAHWEALGLTGWPQGDLGGWFRYSAETGRVHRGRLIADLTATEWTGWRADSGHVSIDFPPSGPVTFDVRARRRQGVMLLEGRAAEGGWDGRYALKDFPLDEWPDGRASGIHGVLGEGAGTVHGVNGALDVTGELRGRATQWMGATFARWSLHHVHGRLLPKPDVLADVGLEDVMFLGLHFDSAASAIHLGDQRLAFDGLRSVAGDTLATMDGGASWNAHGWTLDSPRAEFSSHHFDWQVDPPLRLAGDPHGVDIERLVAADGAARIEAGGRWAAPGGVYDWTGRATHLDLARLGLPDDLGLAGDADAELHVSGVSGAPHWNLTAVARRPAFDGHAADSLALVLAGAPSQLEVRQAALIVGSGGIRASGRVDGTTHRWPDSLTAAGVVRWLSDAASWEGHVIASRIAIDRWHALWPQAQDWRGDFDGLLTLGGRPAAPEFQAQLHAVGLEWRGFSLGEATANATYRPGDLTVDKLELHREGLTFAANGHVPLDLALGSEPHLPERPMAWRAHLPDGDLAILPQLVPQIGYAAGRFGVDLQVTGTPKSPNLLGTTTVREGRVRLAGREEVLEAVYADARLAGGTLTVDSLSARQTSRSRTIRGTVRGRGVAHLDGAGLKDYRFDLALRNFTAIEPSLYVAQFDGDFVVANGPRVNGQVLPMVTCDDVRVDNAYILFDFTKQTEVQAIAASTQPLFWLYRLNVNAKDNLNWKPSDADVEFSSELTVEQTPDSLLIYGDLKSLRGTYYFLANRFTVDKADLSFDNVGGVDPNLRISAHTRLTTVDELSGETTPYTIYVDINGRSKEPEITFRSDPVGLDEARILREITLGTPGRGVGGVVGDPLDSYLSRQLNRQLSTELSKAFRGYLNDWELSRQSGGLFTGSGDVILGVGSQINSSLAVRYRQRLPGTTRASTTSYVNADDLLERDIEAEYRLNRFFAVTSELAQRHSVTGAGVSTTAVPSFSVNLRARWEY